MAKILIINSDQNFSRQATGTLAREGHNVHAVRFLTEALLGSEIAGAEIIFVDSPQVMHDPSNTLSFLIAQDLEPDIVVLARDLDSEAHHEMIEMGAWDVRHQPDNPEELKRILSQVLEYRSGKRAKEDILQEVLQFSPGLVTNSNLSLTPIYI